MGEIDSEAWTELHAAVIADLGVIFTLLRGGPLTERTRALGVRAAALRAAVNRWRFVAPTPSQIGATAELVAELLQRAHDTSGTIPAVRAGLAHRAVSEGTSYAKALGARR